MSSTLKPGAIMNYEEVGAIEAIVASINTLKDGSIKLTLELNPDNAPVINKLMTKFLNNERLFTIGIMQCVEKRGGNDV